MTSHITARRQARDQFRFYQAEHERAGKTEKAATNQQFADMCDAALAAPVTDAMVERELDRWFGNGGDWRAKRLTMTRKENHEFISLCRREMRAALIAALTDPQPPAEAGDA